MTWKKVKDIQDKKNTTETQSDKYTEAALMKQVNVSLSFKGLASYVYKRSPIK